MAGAPLLRLLHMGRSGQTTIAAAPQRTKTTATVKLTVADAATAIDVLQKDLTRLDDFGPEDYSQSWVDELTERAGDAIERLQAKNRITDIDAYLVLGSIDHEREHLEDNGAAEYTAAELKKKQDAMTRLAAALKGKACDSHEFFARVGAADCPNCGKTAILDRHGELCPECVDVEGEKCVFCGDRYPPDEFEDGLRCRHCAEEDDKTACINCGAEIDEAGSTVFCVECREDDTSDDE